MPLALQAPKELKRPDVFCCSCGTSKSYSSFCARHWFTPKQGAGSQRKTMMLPAGTSEAQIIFPHQC